ncbi:Na+/H+ antiporter NhaC family protein [Candidatus Poribacteria bacterium]|nr:Na+/H+ antiporter NhaC family protein [Candidatus Poribacteria bacterium]
MNFKLKIALPGFIFLAICIIAIWRASNLEPSNALIWYSIIPPLLAITLAIVTNRLLPSLASAIVAGVFLASLRKCPPSIGAWSASLTSDTISLIKSVSGSFNIQVIAFIVLILSMIAVMIASGGLQGVINWLSRFAKGPRSTQLVTVLMGLAVFIDDYANTMIVGSAMRPTTDKHKISREKLSFLVDATTAPVAGLAIVSTWIGYEVYLFNSVAESVGIQRDGYAMFFDALGFRFYCIMMIIFVFVNVISGRDFGAMRKAEERARTTGAVIAQDANPMTSKVFSTLSYATEAKILGRSATIPIVTLFAVMFISFWVVGKGEGSILSTSAWRAAISTTSANDDSLKILAIASGGGFLMSILCATLFSRISFGAIGSAIGTGLKGSLLPTAILILAWGLKEVCDEEMLGTGNFLATMLRDVLSPIWFPAVLFVVASLTSFATGTSWGTMAILIPTAIPIAFNLDGDVYGLTTIICLGAVLDGSIFGDHCSPISDTTIMSSIASSCDHIHHVRTQLPYSLTVAGLALVCGYIPAALGIPSLVGIGVSVVLIAGLFYVVGKSHPDSRSKA